MKIICQICQEHIATAKKQNLSAPITGAMFQSPYPDRMPEPPFEPAEWEHIKCPMCKFRPFLKDDEVLTDNGIYKIVKLKSHEQIYNCELCDREVKGALAYASHLKKCRKHEILYRRF